jgi:hypothetical protein
MRMFLLIAVALPSFALAQSPSPAPSVPESHIPPRVVMELRTLESQFDLALANDCAPERCFSKGCVYRDHAVVDLPRNGSLPGLPQAEGPGSVPAQEYLTQARCEFTHEKAVNAKDAQALVRRLEQRLSKGWLQVNVARQILEPISPTLRESPPPKPDALPPPPPAPAEAKPLPEVPKEWQAGIAARELWLSLLPHFSWMIAVVMVTFAALILIWGSRRLGRESLEEKAMLAQLNNGGALERDAANGEALENGHANGAANGAAVTDGDDAFLSDQHKVWNERIAQAELTKDDNAIVDLVRHWLSAGEFELLAKAIFVFGDRLSVAFTSDGELAATKVAFGEYLRTVDPQTLPSDAEFFKKLNQHAISSSVLSQADAEVYRSLREEFGSAGVTDLIETVPARYGALLFGLVPGDAQHDVARMMSPELRLRVAEELLASNRISKEELAYLFEVLKSARGGRPLPKAPAPVGIADRGREFDAAGALSVLFPRIAATERLALFNTARERSSGTFPRWYEDILYPDMLLKLPQELQSDLLLDVDVKGLAGWSSVQHPEWQESFLNRLAPSMQSAIRASMAFASRADQFRLARHGHDELVSAVKKQVARGKVSFAEIVA